MAELSQIPPPRCMYLQSNSMTVHGEAVADDTDRPDGLSGCWCVQTGRPLGPDGGDVSLAECRNTRRGCYQEY